MLTTAVIIAAIIAFMMISATFWVNWWWFGSTGYRDLLITNYLSEAVTFVIAGLLAALFFAANWKLVIRNGEKMGLRHQAGPFHGRFGRWVLRLLTIVTAVAAGRAAADNWEMWRLAVAGGSFGDREPIYGLDAGFYIFQLPALTQFHRAALILLGWTALIVVIMYAVSLGLERLDFQNMPGPARRHGLVLIAIGLLLVALGYVINNFNLMYSNRGFAFGPGFTDATVTRPLGFILAIASLVAAALMVFHAFRPGTRGLLPVAGVWLVAVLIGWFLPPIVQQAVVVPNQLSQERPYIGNNIALTRTAYDLDDVESRNLTGQGQPPAAMLNADSPVLDNVRLWDYRIAQSTFQQLRSFVPYYQFLDVDVDRYTMDGGIRQVLISARELNLDGLPPNARVWVNEHLAYTHGYGLVVSPISEATSQGLPRFLVGDVPPEGTGALEVTRPEIYFGEKDETWVAVNTSQPEVTGLAGDTTSSSYQGKGAGSIQVSGYLPRLFLAMALDDRRVLLSTEINNDSRILLHRSISDRLKTIAPFLTYDPDPYLVIANGRLVWVVDAYTTSHLFPGATPQEDGVNYLRNTVKATIDAYDGTVTFYRTAAPDPIADAYAKIYPNLFTPIQQAPAVMLEHFRYPEYIFDIQTQMFTSYHITDPDAFFNGEDKWEISRENGQGDGNSQTTESYFMTLPLPGETDSTFKLVRTFTPNNRQNMTAWMAGQADQFGTPRLVSYRFPRQITIFGPQQVEARINQNPDIASRITLLDQSGSRVIRGNLLVVPIDQSVLYVQPLYLQATATEGAPTELQFVIVATNEAVVMRPTLAEALSAITSADAVSIAGNDETQGGAQAAPTTGLTLDDLTTEAIQAYDDGQSALSRGDWQAYGESQARLKTSLDQIAGIMRATPTAGSAPVTGTPETLPQATPVAQP